MVPYPVMRYGALFLLAAGFLTGAAPVPAPFVPPGTSAWAGSAVVGGRRMHCAAARVVMNRAIPGAGYAAPGRIVLNPRYIRRFPAAVRRMIFLHECAHHYVGADETAADCWAVRRAKRQGWLTLRGVRQVCASFRNSTGGAGHLPGAARCRAMLNCFRGAGVPRRVQVRAKRRRR